MFVCFAPLRQHCCSKAVAQLWQHLLLRIFKRLECVTIMSVVYYSAIMKMQITHLSPVSPNTCGSIPVCLSQTIYWLDIFYFLAHRCRQLLGNCLLIHFPQTRVGIDGVGIVSCTKRLSISLTETSVVPDAAHWCMRARSDDSSFHTSSIVSTWVQGCFCCARVLLFLFLYFHPAFGNQLTMATDRSLFVAAG